MRQLAALAAAVALVVVAVAVRGAIDDGDGSPGSGEPIVVCPVELAEACEALEASTTVRQEPAVITGEALAAGDPTAVGDAGDAGRPADAGETADADGRPQVWITTRPWAEAVADQRARSGLAALPGEPTATIARSPVALVVWDDRADVLARGPCAGTIGWRCVGEAAGRPWSEVGGPVDWGVVRAGLASPDTAGGPVVLGAAVAGFLGTGDYAANDLGGDLSGWLTGWLAPDPVAPGHEPVARMLTRGPGELSAVGALEAHARRAADRADVRVIYPAPVAVAELVALPMGGDDRAAADTAEDVAADDALLDALAAEGWRVDSRPAAPGVDEGITVPGNDGLPDGAVLHALRIRWQEVTG